MSEHTVTTDDDAMRSQFKVKKTGATWGVFYRGALIEGGFFSRGAAEDCAHEHYAAERRELSRQ